MKKELFILIAFISLLFFSCTPTKYSISNLTPSESLYVSGWNCENSYLVFKNKTKDTQYRYISEREIKISPRSKTVVRIDPGKYIVSSGWWESIEIKAYPCFTYTEVIK